MKATLNIFGIAAAYLSWTVNHSVLWALLHYFCGAFYIGYHYQGWLGVGEIVVLAIVLGTVKELIKNAIIRKIVK